MLPQNTTLECTGCGSPGDRRAFVGQVLTLLAATAVLPDVLRADTHVATIAGVRRGRDGVVRYPMPAVDGATVDTANEVIIVRSAGKCMAFALSCPHQRALLRLRSGTTAFQCPKHKSEYTLDGTFIRGRATRNLDRLAIRRDGADLLVDIESEFRSDADAAAWTAATVSA
ncbi:MAG: Rieske 2Fe-2S domain-containing protein [Gemmatimonadota bacterium]